ncbi:MAG: (Fe-S)-binding protein [Planctomycetota bacterium]|jgi:L-lactate dehydrogenase complex protein LldE
MHVKRVSLFVTCLTDLFYPNVAKAMVRIMRRLGIQVDFPEKQTCCGQPALNSGMIQEARDVAARMIHIFENAETVVSPSGSCCSIIREQYPLLFEDDPKMLDRAIVLGQKTFEFVEFLQKKIKVDWSKWNLKFPAIATYHYSCHHRGIGMTPHEVPQLIKQIKGLQYRQLDKIEECCGFGGTFAIKSPKISAAMTRDKVECIKKTGAELVIINEGGCTMNIIGCCHRNGVNVKPIHIAEILDRAMQAGNSKTGAQR